MDHQAQSETELKFLRSLCDESVPREVRQKLARFLSRRVFIEPEHQVVFESIRALLSRGSISATRLTVHLNNRGFPDTEVEKYFQAAPPGQFEHESPNKEP